MSALLNSPRSAVSARLDAATCLRRRFGRQVAACLRVRRSSSEGGKELGYGG